MGCSRLYTEFWYLNSCLARCPDTLWRRLNVHEQTDSPADRDTTHRNQRLHDPPTSTRTAVSTTRSDERWDGGLAGERYRGMDCPDHKGASRSILGIRYLKSSLVIGRITFSRMGSEYLDYLDTPEWGAQRRQARDRTNGRCARELPGTPRHIGPFHTHHVSYEHLGDERPEELEYLCEACHRAEHRPRNRSKRALEAVGQLRLFDRYREVEARETALCERVASLESDVDYYRRLAERLLTALRDLKAA